jgi:hypothetical protein
MVSEAALACTLDLHFSKREGSASASAIDASPALCKQDASVVQVPVQVARYGRSENRRRPFQITARSTRIRTPKKWEWEL